MELKINERFRDALPHLSEEERAMLEQSILEDGCRDSIIVWNGTIVDGHNRYEICRKHGLPFNVVGKQFDDEESVIAWIKIHQASRRNLSMVERARLVLEGKETLAAKAKERQATSTGGAKPQLVPKLAQAEKGRTLDILAKESGIPRETLRKVDSVDRTAPTVLKEAMGKAVSVSAAYDFNRGIKDEPEEMRQEKAQIFVSQEYLRRKKELEEEEKALKDRIWKCNRLSKILSSIIQNPEYFSEEYAECLVREGGQKVSDWILDFDTAIEYLDRTKRLLQKKMTFRVVK